MCCNSFVLNAIFVSLKLCISKSFKLKKNKSPFRQKPIPCNIFIFSHIFANYIILKRIFKVLLVHLPIQFNYDPIQSNPIETKSLGMRLRFAICFGIRIIHLSGDFSKIIFIFFFIYSL